MLDKYEFRIKTDQIKKLIKQKDYPAAMKIADTIDWTRVKNMSLLTMISEVYEKNKKYEESLDILLMVYERYPSGRTVVYKLAELFIHTGEYEEAIHFYQEYVKIAPYDVTSKLILKYKIYRAQGKSLDQQIKILEELKSQDYHEEWAYELAKLYHRAGRVDECVAECDEIDLWFGEGYYVTKAYELKMRHQPLTPVQMKKYENRYAYQEEASEGLQEVNLDGNDPEIKVNTISFNTASLQEELAKSIEQLMQAPDKETVDSTMENVKKLVEESNIPEITPPKPIAYEEILSEDDDGQISLYVPEEDMLEKQITGQMTIEDVLREWEKTKEAAERAIAEAKVRQLEKVRRRALEETGDIMERLQGVLPTLNTEHTTAAAFVDEPYSTSFTEPEAQNFEEESEEAEEIDVMQAPTIRIPDLEHTKEWVISKRLTEARLEDDYAYEKSQEEFVEPEEMPTEPERGLKEPEEASAEPEHEPKEPEEASAEPEREPKEPEEASAEPEHEPTEPEEILAETERGPEAELEAEAKLDSEVELEPEVVEKEKVPEEKMQEAAATEEKMQDVAAAEETIKETPAPAEPAPKEKKKAKKEKAEKTVKAEKKQEAGAGFTSEQKEMLSYFMEIPEVRQALQKMGENYASSSFIVISGMEGSGRTSLATRLIKAAQMAPDSVGRKIAKTTGSALNQKVISQIFERMVQGSLIIEHAEELSLETMENLYQEMKKYEGRLQVYFIGRTKPLMAALKKNELLYAACKYKITLPVYRNDDLVAFAKSYARTQKYSIDEMGVLALYTRIGSRQTQSHRVNLGEVKEIIDEAIANSAKFSPKKFFGRLFATHIDEEGLIILNEKDFQEKEV